MIEALVKRVTSSQIIVIKEQITFLFMPASSGVAFLSSTGSRKSEKGRRGCIVRTSSSMVDARRSKTGMAGEGQREMRQIWQTNLASQRKRDAALVF